MYDLICHCVSTYHTIPNRNPSSIVTAQKRSLKVLLEPVHGRQDRPVTEGVLRDGPVPSDDMDHRRFAGGREDAPELIEDHPAEIRVVELGQFGLPGQGNDGPGEGGGIVRRNRKGIERKAANGYWDGIFS